ncbi:hypothetical protein [Mucilaginibacter humi]|nr:hypothetical protein [Mucilaginibacter humi]
MLDEIAPFKSTLLTIDLDRFSSRLDAGSISISRSVMIRWLFWWMMC